MGEDLHQESSSMAMNGADLYDSPATGLADLDEPNLDNSEDFDLDFIRSGQSGF